MVGGSHHTLHQDLAGFTGGTVGGRRLNVLYEVADTPSRNENKAYQASRLRS